MPSQLTLLHLTEPQVFSPAKVLKVDESNDNRLATRCIVPIIVPVRSITFEQAALLVACGCPLMRAEYLAA